MVSLRQDALLLSLRPFDDLRLVPQASDRRTWSSVDRALGDQLTVRAGKALALQPPQTLASEYKRFLTEGSGPWPLAYTLARERLKALALGECIEGNQRFTQAAADQIYALCEMSDWALRQPQPDYPDFTHAVIDVDACETGALLAVSLRLLEEGLNRLSPRIGARIRRALDERLMEPLINHDPEAWLLSQDETPRAAAALMAVALMMERDDRRRWLALRRILKLLDGYLKERLPDGGFSHGLENHLSEAMAVNDCFSMLSVASGGEVELRDEPLFVDMAGSFVSAHIDQGWFVNPGGDSMRPGLSPDLLFRLGESSRVDSLCGLAAYLRRSQTAAEIPLQQPSEPLLQQVMNALGRSDLLKRAARAPHPEWVELPAMQLLAGRMEGFYAALWGPAGSSAAAGDIALFYQQLPVVVSLKGAHSVPLVNGFSQVSGPGAQDAQHSDGPLWRMLSMNLAGAYPAQAGLVSWQRTWMLASFEGSVRLMEVFDLDAPGKVEFCLLTPDMPRVRTAQALLAGGRISLSYDPSLIARVDSVTAGEAERQVWGQRLFRLTLSTPEPIPGGNYTFLFRPAAGEDG